VSELTCDKIKILVGIAMDLETTICSEKHVFMQYE